MSAFFEAKNAFLTFLQEKYDPKKMGKELQSLAFSDKLAMAKLAKEMMTGKKPSPAMKKKAIEELEDNYVDDSDEDPETREQAKDLIARLKSMK